MEVQAGLRLSLHYHITLSANILRQRQTTKKIHHRPQHQRSINLRLEEVSQSGSTF